MSSNSQKATSFILTMGTQAHRLQWLGTVADALAAEMCLDYLIQQVNRLVKTYQAGGQRTRMEMTDFRTGATAEISRTLDQIVREQETAHAANTGDPRELMVVSKRQAIRARFDVRYGTRRGRAVGDGYTTGEAAAKGVGVRRSVHGSGGPAGYLGRACKTCKLPVKESEQFQ